MIGAHAFRWLPQCDASCLRQEVPRRVLGAEPCLDGVAPKAQFVLPHRERLAPGDTKLPLDQIDPQHRLGHRVLHLEPRIHLHEVELPVRAEQELDRADALVFDRAGKRDGGGAEFLAQRRIDRGGGRLLDQLLVTPLHRAVALAKMHHMAVLVGENLHLDVARIFDRAFEHHPAVTEGMLRLGLRRLESGVEFAPRSRRGACRGRRRRRPP